MKTLEELNQYIERWAHERKLDKKVLPPCKVTGLKQNVYLINYITLTMEVKGDDLFI